MRCQSRFGRVREQGGHDIQVGTARAPPGLQPSTVVFRGPFSEARQYVRGRERKGREKERFGAPTAVLLLRQAFSQARQEVRYRSGEEKLERERLRGEKDAPVHTLHSANSTEYR